jgi:peptidyl-tRNA hydrolase
MERTTPLAKTNKVIKKVNKKIYYSEALAMSLIIQAKKDKIFARELYEIVKKLTKVKKAIEKKSERRAVVLMPLNREYAMRRVNWLIPKIKNNELTGSEEAVQLLSSWAEIHEYSSPKQVVVGIVGLAIPGITLGIIKKKMKMSIIINRDIKNFTKTELTEKVTQASHGILSQALVTAGGEVGKLEPEVADWFFGEKKIVFYKAQTKEVEKIEKELKNLEIIHQKEKIGDETAVLAISPVVNSFFQESFWEIEKIEKEQVI